MIKRVFYTIGTARSAIVTNVGGNMTQNSDHIENIFNSSGTCHWLTHEILFNVYYK